MKYDKEIYRSHYGKIRAVSFLAAVPSWVLCALCDQSINEQVDLLSQYNLFLFLMAGFFSGAAMLELGMGLIICGDLYLHAKMQEQYFLDSLLIVMTVRTRGYPIAMFFDQVYYRLFYVNNINSIKVNHFYIVITGSVELKRYKRPPQEALKPLKTKTIKKLRIPRSFTNEHHILDINIEEYNENAKNVSERKIQEAMK